MDLNLKGKAAIVTGSSRGIGKGIARGLAEEGCNVVICARNEEELNKAAEEIYCNHTKILPLQLDVTKDNDVKKLVSMTVKEFGQIDILINNVGSNRRNPFENTTDEDWQFVLDINVLCHIKLSRLVIPYMKERKSGSIIFISSIFGRESGGAGLSIYNTTKSAVISLSKIMAVELAPYGIRVNNVAPGSIRFPGGSWDRRCIKDPEGMAEFLKRDFPMGRFGTVEEVANLVTFLSSEKASLITGASVNVDGGQSRSLI
jgi:3-oxoacyl-[acyl-carrier protein] reductase